MRSLQDLYFDIDFKTTEKSVQTTIPNSPKSKQFKSVVLHQQAKMAAAMLMTNFGDKRVGDSYWTISSSQENWLNTRKLVELFELMELIAHY